MTEDVEERLSRIEDKMEELKEVPDDYFSETSSAESTTEASVSSSSEETSSEAEEETETCQVEKSDGEVCGRDKPCPYHDEE